MSGGGLMSGLREFSISERADGQLDVVEAPPVGAKSAFSLVLLAEMVRQVGVDGDGQLVVLGLVFRPVGFSPGNVQFGPPQALICERVA